MRFRKTVSKELREEIIRRFQAGELRTTIAEDTGFSRQTICNIIDAVIKPEKVKAKVEAALTKRLTESELEEIKKALATTEPKDHKFTSIPANWDMEYGLMLTQKLCGKKPAVATMRPLLKPYKRKIFYQQEVDPMPQPPKPFDLKSMDPMLAQDEDFVKYCKSPLGKQIAWRSYECALKEWRERNPEKQTTDAKNEIINEVIPVVTKSIGKRIGKHAGSRGSNFQKKKKRRR